MMSIKHFFLFVGLGERLLVSQTISLMKSSLVDVLLLSK